ncbi:hypothetical protein [Mycobacteroides chelonae]|uniref:hypothetical protein n=1 Tax=Mycobacteroides chelonae TaxID=1774 RepID=UPI001041DB52|nr:hypothetical protein [Mycobacteroides chelonae]MBF9349269.1 hypothetical protein [Mycobacteroides chelonae]
MPPQTNDFQQLIAQIIELLEDPVIIEESKLFPDPDTGQDREVDVYALVRGKVDHREITIAVECVARSRKMDVGWVEQMYGKYSVLKVADVVLLVSKKGFYHTAEVKARKFGYKTITPVISPLKLKRTLGLDGEHRFGVQMATFSYRDVFIDVGVAGEFIADEWYYRADRSQLVKAGDFLLNAALGPRGGPMAFAGQENLTTTWPVEVPNPIHENEALHAWIQIDSGEKVLARVQAVRFTAWWSSTNAGMFSQTEQVEFDGVTIGTGVDTIAGQQARMVVTNDDQGNWKSLTKFQYAMHTPESQKELAAPNENGLSDRE